MRQAHAAVGVVLFFAGASAPATEPARSGSAGDLETAVAADVAADLGVAAALPSPHQFGTGLGGGFAADARQQCLYCHAPAASPLADVVRPAWGGGQVIGAATPGAVVAPTTNSYGDHAESMVCLSCHDGSIGAAHGASALGRDPRGEHPFAIRYSDFDTTGYRSRAELQAAGLPLYGPGRDQIECCTCHDPHSNRHGSYLRMPNSRSRLCLACHNK